MNNITIEIPGEPQSQTRHRHTSRGGFVRTYDPKAKDKEKLLKYIKANYDLTKIEGMIEARIIANFGIPKSYSNKKTETLHDQYRPKKPDVDNIAKFYLDTLNGIAYNDDSQIVYLEVNKHYSKFPSVTIILREVLF